MRISILAAISVCFLVLPASAGRIQSGGDLVRECTEYLGRGAAQDNNVARVPHPCRTFLQGFFVTLIERENQRRDAMIKGLPYAAKEKCVRLPDFLSYADMAQRVVNFGRANAQANALPATTLAQQTLERDFPCPPINKPAMKPN
jgi:hypothetical protein